jgi:hypothetical protein
MGALGIKWNIVNYENWSQVTDILHFMTIYLLICILKCLVCEWLATGQWLFPDTLVSSIDKADCHDITEILLKVAFSTISYNPNPIKCLSYARE